MGGGGKETGVFEGKTIKQGENLAKDRRVRKAQSKSAKWKADERVEEREMRLKRNFHL